MANDVKITVSESGGRRRASSGSAWEPKVGYSRAVRVGSTIAITGTVGVNADGTLPKTVGEQTRRALQIIQAAIEALGGKIEDVVRTRMFVTDISQWEAVGAGHGDLNVIRHAALDASRRGRRASRHGASPSRRGRSRASAPTGRP